MPGLAAAIGAHPYLYLVAERIAQRKFDADDAMALIRYSDLSHEETNAHPGIHISISSPARTPDFHFYGEPNKKHPNGKYAKRKRHSMFLSENDAALAVAGALNTQAGAETISRLHHLRPSGRGVLYSRSGAVPEIGVNRSAELGGVSWKENSIGFVTLVLDHDGQGVLVLQSVYPNLEFRADHTAVPPNGADLLEMPRGQYAVFWQSGL